MNEITTVGVDLAKELIVVCAGDSSGKALFLKQFGCAGFAAWAANLPPCAIGMEACSSAHHWAKRLSALPGIGPITASALLATVTNPRDFRNGRQLAAWTGVVPRQCSSGGKLRLGPHYPARRWLPAGAAHPRGSFDAARRTQASSRKALTTRTIG